MNNFFNKYNKYNKYKYKLIKNKKIGGIIVESYVINTLYDILAKTIITTIQKLFGKLTFKYTKIEIASKNIHEIISDTISENIIKSAENYMNKRTTTGPKINITQITPKINLDDKLLQTYKKEYKKTIEFLSLFKYDILLKCLSLFKENKIDINSINLTSFKDEVLYNHIENFNETLKDNESLQKNIKENLDNYNEIQKFLKDKMKPYQFQNDFNEIIKFYNEDDEQKGMNELMK